MEMKLSIFLPVYNFINQQDAATSQVYCLLFKYSSTCFGHPHAHHQELQQLQQKPLVYRQSLVIAVLLVVFGLVGPRPTALLSPTRGCCCSCSSWWWAWGCPKHVELYLNENLGICCILFFSSVDSMMMHGLANTKFSVCLHNRTIHMRNPLKPSRMWK